MIAAAGLPGIAVLALGLFLFASAVIAARWRRPAEIGGARDLASLVGIGTQALAFVLVAHGPVHATLDPLGTTALVAAGIVAVLMATTLALFGWSRATMGRNWSVVARTRADHALVTTGPFARVRNPIYVAIGLMVIATALALGHMRWLGIAVPVYMLGTWLRVRSEERLLRAMFGATYDAYAARVKRFVPGLF